jgi:hypothetical protein
MGFFHLLIINIINTILRFGAKIDPVFCLASKTQCTHN